MTISKIEFDPDRNIIENIFRESLRIEIPRYQRSYTWTTKETEDFFNDFIRESETPEDNFDFLGTILFTLDEKHGVLEVIDGQQRLLTITLFFAAMRDLLRFDVDSSQAYSLSDDIHNNYIKTGGGMISAHGNEAKNPYRIKVGRDLEQFFSNLAENFVEDPKKLKPKAGAEKRAYDSYMYFRSNVKSLIAGQSPSFQAKGIARIVSKILGIQFIDIRVRNSEVAYNLFESHNAKGQALAKTDLIKNFYFGRLKLSDEKKISKMDEWDDLLSTLEEKTNGMYPDRFFNYMVQSYIGNFSSSHLYRRIKPMIENPENFSKIMKENINSMVELKTAATTDKVVNSSLEGLNEYLRVHQCFIFLLSLYRNRDKITPSTYRRLVKTVENFSYLYSAVGSQPTNVLEKIYSKYASALDNNAKLVKKGDANAMQRLGGTLLSGINKDFKSLIPSQESFTESFRKLSYDNLRERKLLRYTFQKIEEKNSDDLIRLGYGFTLDHIIPQKTFNKLTATEYHSIGNLVPLSALDNSKLGSTKPEDKMDTYSANSQLISVDMLLSQLEEGEFNTDSIEVRTLRLADVAYNEIFKLG